MRTFALLPGTLLVHICCWLGLRGHCLITLGLTNKACAAAARKFLHEHAKTLCVSQRHNFVDRSGRYSIKVLFSHMYKKMTIFSALDQLVRRLRAQQQDQECVLDASPLAVERLLECLHKVRTKCNPRRLRMVSLFVSDSKTLVLPSQAVRTSKVSSCIACFEYLQMHGCIRTLSTLVLAPGFKRKIPVNSGLMVLDFRHTFFEDGMRKAVLGALATGQHPLVHTVLLGYSRSDDAVHVEELDAVAKGCPRLRNLDLSMVMYYRDFSQGLAVLAKHARNLRRLQVHGLIMDLLSLWQFCLACRQLESLVLLGCCAFDRTERRYADGHWQGLLETLPNLRYANLGQVTPAETQDLLAWGATREPPIQFGVEGAFGNLDDGDIDNSGTQGKLRVEEWYTSHLAE